MRDGSGRWLPSQWRDLTHLTLRAIDSVTADNEPAPSWTFGGEAALSLELDHRFSYDIDALLDSARLIQRLVPVINTVTRTICWNDETQRPDYQYQGHSLKLIVKGIGEIDFLGASPLLEDATTLFEFEGRTIIRERPCEIIARKIYQRGSTFNARDIFDLVGTYVVLPEELTNASSSPFLTSDIYSRVRFRIKARMKAFEQEIVDEVNPTDFGRSYVQNACELALDALDFMEKRRLGRTCEPGPD